MKIMRIRYQILALALAALALGLNGCGGGGDTPAAGDGYNGNTSQATLTADNKDDFAITALDAGGNANQLNNTTGFSETTPPAKKAQRASLLSMLAEQVKDNMLTSQANSSPSFSGNSVTSAPVSGTCPTNPGSMTFTDNSSSGNIDSTITYANFCTGDATSGEFILNGQVHITGTVSTGGGNTTIKIAFNKFTMTLKTTSGTSTDSFSGSIELTLDGNNQTIGIKYTVVFNSDGQVYKIENMSIVATSTSLSINGKFYHPVHGSVEITTTKVFTLIAGSNPPQYCGGSLKISGSGGDIDFTDTSGNCSEYKVCFTATGTTTDPANCSTNTWP